MPADDKASVEAAHLPWRPLGELFVARGLITELELETALAEQAATNKRLGEILVDRGLVSGPDLTSVLMEQLGVEISKEEGFGSGLWAEIKRRHRRDPGLADDDAARDEDEIEGSFVLLPGGAEDGESEAWVELDTPAASEALPVPSEFDEELDGLAADYSPPQPFGAAPDTTEVEPAEQAGEERDEDVFALEYSSEPLVEEPERVAEEQAVHGSEEDLVGSFEEPVSFDEPEALEPVMDFEAWPEPAHEPAIAAELDEAATLRAELADARVEIEHLHGMLVDSMTALTALSSEMKAAAEAAPDEHPH